MERMPQLLNVRIQSRSHPCPTSGCNPNWLEWREQLAPCVAEFPLTCQKWPCLWTWAIHSDAGLPNAGTAPASSSESRIITALQSWKTGTNIKHQNLPKLQVRVAQEMQFFKCVGLYDEPVWERCSLVLRLGWSWMCFWSWGEGDPTQQGSHASVVVSRVFNQVLFIRQFCGHCCHLVELLRRGAKTPAWNDWLRTVKTGPADWHFPTTHAKEVWRHVVWITQIYNLKYPEVCHHTQVHVSSWSH